MWPWQKKKSQFIKVTFTNPESGSEFPLHYQLLPTSSAQRWLNLLNSANQVSEIEEGGVFYGENFYARDELVREFNQVIKTINSFGLHNIKNRIHENLTQDELNSLHAWFEKICDLPEYRLPVAGHEVYSAVRRLNILVHRFERLIEKSDLHNIVVPYLPRVAQPLTENDYGNFSLDAKSGYMYLSYARVGVPYLNAFYTGGENNPISQEEMTANVLLRFGPDRIFTQHSELTIWLKEIHSRDISDPTLALGALPVAKLICEPTDVLEQIRNHRHVARIEPVENLPEAKWPALAEIFTQLDLVPFIDLKIRFDHGACLTEAMNLLPRFVSHRSYDVGNGWKSLALNAQDGFENKTDHYTNYSKKERPYKLTRAAKDCPKTISFLSHLTDLSKCKRIRFMLLEPGAKIAVHRDGKDVYSGVALNIALNMPEGCVFTIDSREDGSPTEYTKTIPFADGSVMLINNSRFHYLENNSSVPRIHIIVHGPLRISEKRILELARKQNGVKSEADAVHKLILKKARLNEDLKPSDRLYYDWVSHGFGLKSHIKVGIVEDLDQVEPLRTEAVDKITGASLFPIEYERISPADVEKRNDLVFVPAGTFIEDPYLFAYSALRRRNDPFPKASIEVSKAAVSRLLQRARDHVYHFNNEPMRQFGPTSFAPNKLISVASGLKLFTTIRDLFPQGHVPIILMDQSAPALRYLLSLCNARSHQEFLSVIEKGLPPAVAAEKFHSFLSEEFAGDFSGLKKIIDRIDLVGVIEGDLLTQSENLLGLIQPNDRIYFWHSNVWRANWSYFRFTKAEMRENYAKFIRRLATKLGQRAWIKQSHLFEAVIGTSLEKPTSICSEHLECDVFHANDFRFQYPNYDTAVPLES